VLKLYNIKRVSANIIAKSLGDGAGYCIYGVCVNECFEWGLCWVRCGGGFCRLKNFVFFALGVVGLIWILWVLLGLYFALTF
jgi:hypothetical protein